MLLGARKYLSICIYTNIVLQETWFLMRDLRLLVWSLVLPEAAEEN
jgi:hypothetical protein